MLLLLQSCSGCVNGGGVLLLLFLLLLQCVVYYCCCCCSVSVEVEHYIHDKSFRQRMILLSLSNSKLGQFLDKVS